MYLLYGPNNSNNRSHALMANDIIAKLLQRISDSRVVRGLVTVIRVVRVVRVIRG